MAADPAAAFATLKAILAKPANRLAVRTDTAGEYALTAKSPSPFPQHKGHPLEFASVRISKSYVSFHLMPVYMNAALSRGISPSGVKKSGCESRVPAPLPCGLARRAALSIK